ALPSRILRRSGTDASHTCPGRPTISWSANGDTDFAKGWWMQAFQSVKQYSIQATSRSAPASPQLLGSSPFVIARQHCFLRTMKWQSDLSNVSARQVLPCLTTYP